LCPQLYVKVSTQKRWLPGPTGGSIVVEINFHKTQAKHYGYLYFEMVYLKYIFPICQKLKVGLRAEDNIDTQRKQNHL